MNKEVEIKIGDRVKILYAGTQPWATGKFGQIVENDFDKYDYKVELESSPIRFIYFYKDELEKV